MGVVEGLRYARQRNLKKLPHWSLGSREGCSRRRGGGRHGGVCEGGTWIGETGEGGEGRMGDGAGTWAAGERRQTDGVGILAHPPPPWTEEAALAGGSCLSQGRKTPTSAGGRASCGSFGGLPPRSFYVTCVPWVLSTCGWEFWVPLGRLVAVSVGAGTIVMNVESLRV